MARLRNEEACVVLLTILGRLAADDSTFIHDVALKGGILMAGELGSPRVSADIDVTTGEMRRMDAERIVDDLRSVGRDLDVRQRGAPTRTPGGTIVHLSFESRTDGGGAKLEVSVREDLVFSVRDAFFDVSDLGIGTYYLPALAEVEIVSEKIRTLVQRAQPRDLFDLRLQLVDSGWHLEPADLRKGVEAKLSITKYKRWRGGLWRNHLDEIKAIWETVLQDWVEPNQIPDFDETVTVVAKRMRELRLD
ncbi:MAG: nucleotidyl transferase AbiEii/AbiGii toxin family protein [Chloroflexota bacterium]